MSQFPSPQIDQKYGIISFNVIKNMDVELRQECGTWAYSQDLYRDTMLQALASVDDRVLP
jgi:hypothetical protein